MTTKLMSPSVITQAMNLSLEQVKATMEGGGATVQLDSAVCVGMMPGGDFVYKCTGTSYRKTYEKPVVGSKFEVTKEDVFPQWLAMFKIKVRHSKNFLKGWNEEYLVGAKLRVLDDDFVVYWS